MKKLQSLYLVFVLLFISELSFAEFIDETLEMDADGRVSIEVLGGAVIIQGWDKNEFHIEGELNDNAEGFALEAFGGNISFEEEFPENSGWTCWFNGSCARGSRGKSNYTISIPTGSRLSFEGINVDLTISDLENDLNAETVNGDIEVSNIIGHVQLEAVNGDIESTFLSGRIDHSTVNGKISTTESNAERANFETVNGDISLNIDSPRLEIEAVNGNITLITGMMNDLSIETVNGDSEVELSLMDNAEIEISSLSGDIELLLPSNTSANFEIETGGRIRNRLSGDEAKSESRYSRTRFLNFSLNGGESTIELTSLNGDIRLDEK